LTATSDNWQLLVVSFRQAFPDIVDLFWMR
jgi:hypothetical protein